MVFPSAVRWKVSLAAALALLLHAVMPLFAGTVAAAGSSPGWMEVCSGGQVRLVPATAPDAQSASLDASNAHTFTSSIDECSLCSQVGSAAVPDGTGRGQPPSSPRGSPDFIVFDVPDRHFVWSIEHRRSPPSRN